MKGLVKVHPVGEAKGDDPEAVKTQVVAALARGDLTAARAAFAKLPEDERTAAAAWAKDAEGVAAARAAAAFSHRDVAFAPRGAKKIV